MPYGLQCWDENGDLILDTNGRYSRLVYTEITDTNGSVDLPAIEGHESIQWGEPLQEYMSEFWESAPAVERDGTTISWSDPEGDFKFMILVFIYT